MNNMKNRIILILIFILSGICARAQIRYGELVPDDKKAFQNGEELVLLVNYRIGILNTDVATVKFSLEETEFENKKTYLIHAIGEMDDAYSWFFQMRDVYRCWIKTDNLRPVYFENDLREGSYRFVSNYRYNWDSMKVHTTFRNLKWEEYRRKTMTLTEGSYDALALFYNLRCIDVDKLEENKKYILSLVLKDTIRPVYYKFLGREQKTIRGLGKFNTLKFACQLTTTSGESFKDGDQFYIWFTDDRNKVPLYGDVPIRVGSVRVRLSKYNNLKFPLTSKIK